MRSLLIISFFGIIGTVLANSTNSSAGLVLSSRDKLAVEELKNSISPDELYRDFMRSDFYLIRWIQDQDYDLSLAGTKLRKSLQWRKDNQIDTIIQELDFSDMSRFCNFEQAGDDNEGRPVLILSAGKCDIRKLMLSGNEERFYKFIYQSIEKAMEVIRKKILNGESVSQVVIILDIQGFNWRQHGCLKCMQFLPKVLNVLNDNYPSFINVIYLVNVPKIFNSFVDLFLPVLPDNLKSLLHFYGHDKSEWSRVLSKTIQPDQLPPNFGGTRVMI